MKGKINMRNRSISIFVFIAILILPLAFVLSAAAAEPGDVVINEIMQNPSAVFDSNGEWFEVYNPTTSDIDIDGWTIMDDDFDSFVIDNGGSLIIPADGYLVLGNNADSSTNGGVSVDYEYLSEFPDGIFLGNGSDELVLLDSSSTEIDRVAWDNGATFPDPNGASMALIDPALDNNVGANWCESQTAFGDGDFGTPGAANDCPTEPPPGPPEVTIMEIQGAGHVSPYLFQEVTTTGVVTAVAFNGYYIQDPIGDGDPATSDGLFVFRSSGLPSVGDYLQITDTVTEFIPGGASTGNLSTTQMSFPDTVNMGTMALPEPVVIGTSGRIAPAVDVISRDERPVNLQDVPGVFNPDNDGIDFYESLEGMLVTIEDPVAVSATRTFSPFSSEMFTLTNNGDNIAPADARTARGGINLQPDPHNDGDQNPERVQIQFDPTLSGGASVPAITVGDRLGDVTGVVGYDFGNFQVNALHQVTFTPEGLARETTELSGGNKVVTVASYNVLNLDPLPADDNQRATLASQITDNLGGPDVIALQEIQDNNGTINDGTTDATLTLQALADAVVAAGGPSYEFFDVAPEDGTSGGAPGGNIRNAFFYNPDRVQLVDFVSLTPDVLKKFGVSNEDAFAGTRNPLLATFKFSGKEFTVINNHLSSRFGSTPVFGGPQPFFQAAEDAREAQTGTLNEVVDALLDGGKGNSNHASKAGRVIVLGDLNTMEFTDDMTEILPGTGDERVLTNLIDTLSDDNVYTFNFEGNSQVLDHMFVTDNLMPGVEFDIVHVNVDFPRIDNSVGSDHEPLLAALEIKPDVAFTLTILHNNDGESDLLGDGDFGGVDLFKTVVDNAKWDAANGPHDEDQIGAKRGVIMVSSGDNFLASPEFTASLEKGVPFYDTMALDLIGYDAIDIGNHDFDFGPDILADFIEGYSLTQPPYLSANLDFSGEPRLQSLVDQGRIAASTVVKVRGEEIGIIGATTPNLSFISSPRNVVVNEVQSAVQAEVDKLEAMGVDKIIFISHLQDIEGDIALAEELTGIDVMVAGGGDELLANPGDLLVPGDESEVFGAYPQTAVDMDGNSLPVVTTSGQYFYLGRLVVDFDKWGNVINIGTDSGPVRVAGGNCDDTLPCDDAVAPDPQMHAMVTEPVAAFVAELESNVIGSSAFDLDGRRSSVRSMEANEGNLIADALRWQAAQLAGDFGVPVPDVALQNGGGIRNDDIIPAGDITEKDTFDMVPFPNFVSVFPAIPREQFKEIMENTVSRAVAGDIPGGTGRFAQISGFSMSWSESGTAQVLDGDGNVTTPGTRVQSIVLDDGTAIVVGGVVQAGDPVTVATIDFLARGGDQYPFRGEPFTVLGASYQQALANYIVDGLGGVIDGADYEFGVNLRNFRLP
jgi:2',3'-cyclic-nucleotide 2'-phosphodiesterase (5'-nucleotidase family)